MKGRLLYGEGKAALGLQANEIRRVERDGGGGGGGPVKRGREERERGRVGLGVDGVQSIYWGPRTWGMLSFDC